MGENKAFLVLREKELIEYSLEIARNSADEFFLVGERDLYMAYGRTIADIYPGHGPLGGIHAALHRSTTDFNLVLPVDTPFLEQSFVDYMVVAARRSGAMVTLPRTADGTHPLTAVYRRSFLPLAEQALKEGRNKLDTAFSKDGVQEIDVSTPEISEKGFSASMFDNLNTAEDYQRAADRMARRTI